MASARQPKLAMMKQGVRVCTILAAATAQAAGQSAPEAPQLQDIVVTAQKREQTLLTVPISATALSAADLESRSVATIADLSNSIPNVSFTAGSGDDGISSGVIFIRGIGQTDYANSTDPGVGTYIDGVYLGRTVGGALDLPDISQVEVLRGPQGTLFGKNTMGGAINITTGKPAEGTGGWAAITYGSRNRIDGDAVADIRLDQDWSIHAAFAYRHQDGFVRRLNGGDDTGAQDSRIGRVKIDYQPGEDFKAELSIDYSDLFQTTPRVVTHINDQQNLALLWNNAPPALIPSLVSGGRLPPNPAFGFTPYAARVGQRISNEYATSDLRSTNATGSYDNPFKGGGASLRLDWRVAPDVTLRSISAFRGFDSYSDADQDGQSIAWGQVRYYDRQIQLSQEFNLIGEAFDDRLDWIAGAYFYYERPRADQIINIAYPLLALEDSFVTDTRSYAGFAQGDYKLTDALTFTVGLRYTRDDKDFFSETRCRPGIQDAIGVCSPKGYDVPPTNAGNSWESYDPRLGLRYQFTPDVMTYLTYSTGFKSGGFNARSSTPDQVQPYGPETVSSVEGGVKASLFDRRLQISGAGFHYDYDRYQITASGNDLRTGRTLSVVGNVGSAEINGFEAEAVARPARWLTVNAATGYLDAHYTTLSSQLAEFFAASGSPPVLLGNKLPKTPKWTANFGAQAQAPIGEFADVTARIDYAWVATQYSDVQNFAGTRSPGHSNLNARIVFRPRSAPWEIALYGKNLTDEKYIVNGFIPNGGGGPQTLIIPNAPLEIGAQFRYNFGA